MTLRQAMLSIMHLLFVCTIFGAGFFCISLVYLPDLRIRLADILLMQPDLCITLGLCLFGIAFLLLLGLYGLNRGNYLRFVMGKHRVEIKEKIIRETIEGFFKAQGKNFSLVDVEIKGKSALELRVSLRDVLSMDQAESLLEQTEKELSDLFYERFGYKKPFILSLDAQKLS